MLSTANLRLPGAKKLNSKWLGPFKITAVISPVAYRLELPSTMAIHPVFHASLLKPYHKDTTDSQRHYKRPPPVLGTEIYLAERILDKRFVERNGKMSPEYLVQWQGYPIYEATWEPSQNLLGSEVKTMKILIDKLKPKPPTAR